MKKLLILLAAVCLCCGSLVLAAEKPAAVECDCCNKEKPATAAATAGGSDTAQYPSCQYCGMNREAFAQSRMQIRYSDGTVAATCSIHCAAVELANAIDRMPTDIMVADYGTRKLIDAEKATWVIVAGKPGVMTKNAKWAFAEKADADAFVKANGGNVAGFEAAIRSAYEDMYQDTKMIRDKRSKMKMKKS
jgi:nitrous oxide reductase accessory protein NosL